MGSYDVVIVCDGTRHLVDGCLAVIHLKECNAGLRVCFVVDMGVEEEGRQRQAEFAWVEQVKDSWLDRALIDRTMVKSAAMDDGDLFIPAESNLAFSKVWTDVDFVNDQGCMERIDRAFGKVDVHRIYLLAQRLADVTIADCKVHKVVKNQLSKSMQVDFANNQHEVIHGKVVVEISKLAAKEEERGGVTFESIYAEELIGCDHGWDLNHGRIMDWSIMDISQAEQKAYPDSYLQILPHSEDRLFLREIIPIHDTKVPVNILKARLKKRKEFLGLGTRSHMVSNSESSYIPIHSSSTNDGEERFDMEGIRMIRFSLPNDQIAPNCGFRFGKLVEEIPNLTNAVLKKEAYRNAINRKSWIIVTFIRLMNFLLMRLRERTRFAVWFQTLYGNTPDWFHIVTGKDDLTTYELLRNLMYFLCNYSQGTFQDIFLGVLSFLFSIFRKK